MATRNRTPLFRKYRDALRHIRTPAGRPPPLLLLRGRRGRAGGDRDGLAAPPRPQLRALSTEDHVNLAVAAADGVAAEANAAVDEALPVVVPVRVAAPAVVDGVPRAAR
ncbi:hypothetical protein ZWY2020_002628 [Hordeum vulgare]|nr:hypothetical protein ZWY2020_002628 [Hordeum vulgare]